MEQSNGHNQLSIADRLHWRLRMFASRKIS